MTTMHPATGKKTLRATLSLMKRCWIYYVFFLPVVGFQNFRPFGPGVVFPSLQRRSGHNFQLGDFRCALSQTSSHAVVPRVASSCNDNFLPFG